MPEATAGTDKATSGEHIISAMLLPTDTLYNGINPESDPISRVLEKGLFLYTNLAGLSNSEIFENLERFKDHAHFLRDYAKEKGEYPLDIPRANIVKALNNIQRLNKEEGFIFWNKLAKMEEKDLLSI